jgi:hypothetical protein
MGYSYQIEFDIHPDQMSQLEIGEALERVLGYLKTLLPNEPGHITSRAMFSVNDPETTHMIFESIWETWAFLEAHRSSALSENKVLQEFQPHVSMEHLQVRTFEEVQ